jgi:hypothetical protein
MLMILHEVLAFTIQCANIRDERPMAQCLPVCIYLSMPLNAYHEAAPSNEIFDGWGRASK